MKGTISGAAGIGAAVSPTTRYIPGPQGERGPEGPKGDKGDAFTYSDFTEEQLAALTGPQGPKGDTGPKGEPGDAFTYADFTPEQLAGLTGPKGDKGDTGPAGPAGPKGDSGPQGDTGPQGPKGDTGPQGTAGPQGPKGDPGSDASVTEESIAEALGYAPANGDDYVESHQSELDAGKLMGVNANGDVVPVEREVLICTITGTGTASSPYACDKTTAEIAQAAAAGKVVYALGGSICYPVTIANAGLVRFEVLNGENDTGFMMLPNGIIAKFQNKLQGTSDRVTSLSAASTDAQYPSAKCVWDAIQEIGGGGETWETIDTITLESGVVQYVLAQALTYKKVRLRIRKTYANTGSGNCWIGVYNGDGSYTRFMFDNGAIKAARADAVIDMSDFLQMEISYGNNLLTASGLHQTARISFTSELDTDSVLRMDIAESYTEAFDGTGTMLVEGVLR